MRLFSSYFFYAFVSNFKQLKKGTVSGKNGHPDRSVRKQAKRTETFTWQTNNERSNQTNKQKKQPTNKQINNKHRKQPKNNS